MGNCISERVHEKDDEQVNNNRAGDFTQFKDNNFDVQKAQFEEMSRL